MFDYLETAIISSMSLKKKFGYFRITENHIKLGPNQNVRVWIHEDPVLNYRQFSLSPEKGNERIMV